MSRQATSPAYRLHTFTHCGVQPSNWGALLSEAFGHAQDSLSDRIEPAVKRAIDKSLALQKRPKRSPINRNGWRYVLGQKRQNDADLSVTAWELIFLRSAKNAGFDVPEEPIRQAVEYIKRCFDRTKGTFVYAPRDWERHDRRAMAGAGIMALAASSNHRNLRTEAAGAWLLRHPFDEYNVYNAPIGFERFHYETFYCSQAMFQLGGTYWKEFYPVLVKTLLENQRPSGAWEAENGPDGMFGNAYTTALAVLALAPPNQMLPVFQR